jgi:hypothetical protein
MNQKWKILTNRMPTKIELTLTPILALEFHSRRKTCFQLDASDLIAFFVDLIIDEKIYEIKFSWRQN